MCLMNYYAKIYGRQIANLYLPYKPRQLNFAYGKLIIYMSIFNYLKYKILFKQRKEIERQVISLGVDSIQVKVGSVC